MREYKNPPPRVHHPFSPSKLQSLEACPCYESTQNDSEASRVGTAQHSIAESGLDDPTLSDHKVAAAAECMRFVDERAAKYPGGILSKEEYLPIDNTVIEDAGTGYIGTTGGFADVTLVSADRKHGEIIDFKFGAWGVASAENNLQGIAYALGLAHKHPTLESIRVWFVLPHRDEISEFLFTSDEFDKLRVRVRCVVRRAMEARKQADYSTARAATSACLFCANIGKCPAVAEVVIKLGQKYAPLEIPAGITPSLISDPAQASLGIKLAQVVTTWAEAYRAQATAKTIEHPEFVPAGYKLVSMSKRKILFSRKLVELAKRYLAPEDHERLEALYEVPLGKVEKLISTGAPRGGKESTVAAFGAEALEAGILEQGQPYAFLQLDKESHD